MSNVTRNNHFVPQFYLRQWSDDGARIWAYRLLVEHQNVPDWSQVAIRSAASVRDLYTQLISGKEADEFERWVKETFEDPAAPVLARLVADDELRAEDWKHLAGLLAVQDLRTPSNLVSPLSRWAEEIPQLLEESLRGAVDDLKRGRRHVPRPEEPGMAELRQTFRVEVDHDAPAPPGMSQLRAEVTPGRSMWLGSMHLLLNKAVSILGKHKWSIAEPSPGWEWITCDHPVLRLNYNGPDDYSFQGGWDFRGTDLMMPLSPRHLLFTQVGHEHPRRFTFSTDKTVEIQRLFCERAHRFVFARKPARRVAWFRPRIVDAAIVHA